MATVQKATSILPRVAQQPRRRIWALAAGVVLALHGAIHLMGFIVDWQFAHMQTLPYRTSVLGGHLNLGTAGIKSVGILWLVAALGYIIVGVVLAWQGRLWPVPIAAITALSLIPCILAWPDSAFGAVIDVAILATLLVGRGIVTGQRAPRGKERRP
jgi:hypothetical protein